MVGTLSRDDRVRMFYDAKIKQERDARAEKALAYQQGMQAEREKLSGVIEEERRKFTAQAARIAERDFLVAAQAAEIAALKAKLGLQT